MEAGSKNAGVVAALSEDPAAIAAHPHNCIICLCRSAGSVNEQQIIDVLISTEENGLRIQLFSFGRA